MKLKIIHSPETNVTIHLFEPLSIHPTYVKYLPWVFWIASNFVVILKSKGEHVMFKLCPDSDSLIKAKMILSDAKSS